MSNGNVERCAMLLITRSESEYHGDVLFLSFSFFFLFFLTRIRFRARERSGRFFGRLGDGLSGREFRERRGNIWWQWSRRSAPGCAADTYICRDLIALPRFVYSHLSGTLSAWLLYHRGVRCIDLDRVPRIVPALWPWSRNGYRLHAASP